MYRSLAVALLGLAVAGQARAQVDYTTYSGTMTLSAATSTPLTTANVTMAPNTSLPPTFRQLQVVNTGANTVYICWHGGTCAANVGGEPLTAGASDITTLPNQVVPPSFYSPSGTTLSFRN